VLVEDEVALVELVVALAQEVHLFLLHFDDAQLLLGLL